jgi:hypothetical protein
MPRNAQVNAMKAELTDIKTLADQMTDSPHSDFADGPRRFADTPREQIARRLQDAIDELRANVARVELWASALTSFAEPIPEYRPSEWRELNRARSRHAKEPARTQ